VDMYFEKQVKKPHRDLFEGRFARDNSEVRYRSADKAMKNAIMRQELPHMNRRTSPVRLKTPLSTVNELTITPSPKFYSSKIPSDSGQVEIKSVNQIDPKVTIRYNKFRLLKKKRANRNSLCHITNKLEKEKEELQKMEDKNTQVVNRLVKKVIRLKPKTLLYGNKRKIEFKHKQLKKKALFRKSIGK